MRLRVPANYRSIVAGGSAEREFAGLWQQIQWFDGAPTLTQPLVEYFTKVTHWFSCPGYFPGAPSKPPPGPPAPVQIPPGGSPWTLRKARYPE